MHKLLPRGSLIPFSQESATDGVEINRLQGASAAPTQVNSFIVLSSILMLKLINCLIFVGIIGM